MVLNMVHTLRSTINGLKLLMELHFSPRPLLEPIYNIQRNRSLSEDSNLLNKFSFL
jgi:hypothetical protein